MSAHEPWEDNEANEKESVAQRIAVHVGLLARCPIHQDELIDTGEDKLEAAYKWATALVRDNDPMVAVFQGNRLELTDLLQNITHMVPSECPSCARNMAD